MSNFNLTAEIQRAVVRALAEDIGAGDLTAALVPDNTVATATVITRESAILCGRAWFDEVFHRLDPDIQISWNFMDGERIAANATLCTLQGAARALLTGERTGLNFLQTLSGTATETRRYVDAITGEGVSLALAQSGAAVDVIERALHRAEEGTAIAPALGIGQCRGRGVHPLVHPAVVAGEELAIRGCNHRARC